MQYDPIKRSLGNVFNKAPILRKIFYRLLDLLLLRCWHIHKELRRYGRERGANSAPPSILDAGAGFGQYSWWMYRHFKGATILSVDVKEEQVEDCNRFFTQVNAAGVRFEIADLVTFVQPERFDLVLSVDVMEHILEDVRVFRNFHASMRPGGMLLISTPSDQGGSDVHDESGTSFIEEHVRDGYNISEIADKLKSAGFSRVDARYSYGWPGKISWRLSMKFPILALGASKLLFILLPFYYLLVYPVCFVLNAVDIAIKHHTGTGLIVKAWK